MKQKISFKEKITNLKKADEQFLQFVTFLYCMSTSGSNTTELIKHAESSNYGRHTRSIKEISRLGIGWGYGLSRACEVIAEKTSKSKGDQLKQLLVKLAQVIRIGEELKDFFKNEISAATHTFVSAYERNLESQKLFLEMFYTLMSTTSVMIAANSMLTMLTGATDSERILVVSLVAVIATMSAFACMLYMIFPRDKLSTPVHTSGRKFMRLLYISIVLSLMIGLVLYSTKTLPILLIIPVAVLPFFIPAFFAKRIESEIKKLNEWYPPFIRHFGQILSTVGSTKNTLDTTLKSDFGELNKHLKSFSNRIGNRIDRNTSFELFSRDTNSVLITSGNTIFSKCIEIGSDMNEVGNKIADVTSKVNEVKSKRAHIAKTFEIVILILHVMTVAVFALINKISEIFHGMLAGLPSVPGMIHLTPVNPEFLAALMPVIVITLSIINGFAIKIAQGGLYKTVLFHITILTMIGSIAMYATAEILGMFLGKLADFSFV
ncbi:MAG: flagellar assembly protein FlaJ [Nitrosopumilaceae archaeon]|nr:flagellar assembly protein FlaJ [Nitrosopumilaceae archaeon]